MSRAELLKEFLSEPEEVHALVYGLYESLTGEQIPESVRKEVEREYHYYALGKLLGLAVLPLFPHLMFARRFGWLKKRRSWTSSRSSEDRSKT